MPPVWTEKLRRAVTVVLFWEHTALLEALLGWSDFPYPTKQDWDGQSWVFCLKTGWPSVVGAPHLTVGAQHHSKWPAETFLFLLQVSQLHFRNGICSERLGCFKKRFFL